MPPDTVTPGSGGLLARAEFDRLSDRGRRFLGSQVAIMGGAMSWVSERTLVAAISNAGQYTAWNRMMSLPTICTSAGQNGQRGLSVSGNPTADR